MKPFRMEQELKICGLGPFFKYLLSWSEVKRSILIAFGLLMGICNLNSQWIQTDGPYGNVSVSGIFENGTNGFAASSCGLYFCDKVSSRWKHITDISIAEYDQKGDSIFYFGYNDGIKLLILNSEKPTQKFLGPESPIYSIECTDTCLYAGIEPKFPGNGLESGGFAKSNGFTNEWIYYNEGLPRDTMYFPKTNVYYPRFVYAIKTLGDKIFCGTKLGIYISDIDNISWMQSSIGLPKQAVSILEAYNDTLFACLAKTVYMSTNYGGSWSILHTVPSKISEFKIINGEYYITTLGNGIYKSKNLIVWADFNQGLTNLHINTISFIDNTLVCGSLVDGFHYFVEGTWNQNISGMICSGISSISAGRDFIVANSQEEVYVSKNGDNWQDISPNLNFELFGSVATMNDSIFLSVEYDDSDDSPFILISPDEGQNWENLVNPVPFARDDPYNIYCDDGKLYAYEDEFMYVTNDLGETWTDLSLPEHYCFYGFVVFNSVPFAATCGYGLLNSLDDENNWVVSNNGLPSNRQPKALAFCDSALFTYLHADDMYVSFDLGINWSNAGQGIAFNGFAPYGQHLFLSARNGVFATSNYGQKWHSYSDGLFNLDVRCISIVNDTLYAGTGGNGIWKRGIEDINLAISRHKNYKDNIKVYPNPASEYVFININNVDIEYVTILDLLGREVFSEKVISNGIDVQDIPCGTYILLLRSKNKAFRSKIVIN